MVQAYNLQASNTSWPGPNSRGRHALAKQPCSAPKREGSRLSARRGSSNCCLQFGRNSADGTVLYMFQSMFMNGTVAKQIFGFLNIPALQGHVLSMSTDALRRCSPTMPSDWERMSPVARAADPCNASKSCLWSSEAEIGWHWPLLVLVRYCSQTPRKLACFVLPAWDVANTCQDQRKGCLFTSIFYFHSQGKPASTVVPPC